METSECCLFQTDSVVVPSAVDSKEKVVVVEQTVVAGVSAVRGKMAAMGRNSRR
jgi:hypothetical protein